MVLRVGIADQAESASRSNRGDSSTLDEGLAGGAPRNRPESRRFLSLDLWVAQQNVRTTRELRLRSRKPAEQALRR